MHPLRQTLIASISDGERLYPEHFRHHPQLWNGCRSIILFTIHFPICRVAINSSYVAWLMLGYRTAGGADFARAIQRVVDHNETTIEQLWTMMN